MAAASRHVHVEHVMGGPVTIEVRDPTLRPSVLTDALAEAVRLLHHADATFTTFDDASEIRRLDRGVLGIEDCHPDVAEVLARAAVLTARTRGAFDVRSAPDRHLDPSGLVKGWVAQRVADLFTSVGSRHHLVNAAGDIAAVGGSAAGVPWQVGIEHPLHTRQLCSVVPVTTGAVATSGVAARGPHVLDPRSGQPVQELASVTVVGPDLGDADAYATAAMALGLDAPSLLVSLADHEAMVIDGTGHAWQTSGWPGRTFGLETFGAS